MDKPFHLEVISPGMRTKLDMKYRRSFQASRESASVKLKRDLSEGKCKTALPFTTKTRAYGTYFQKEDSTCTFHNSCNPNVKQ